MEPRFLDLAEVLEVHRDQIERYGGAEGIRDLGLLQSSVAMPQAGMGGVYLHGDLYEMAAAYLYHLVCNHPLVDGNKRTGTAAALVFLELNGVRLEVDADELAEMVEAVAAGRVAKTAVTEFLRAHGGG